MPRAYWGMWIAIFVVWAGRVVVPFLTLFFTHEAGYSPTVAGLVVSLVGAGGLLAAATIGGLIDRIGPRRVVLAGLLANAVVCTVMATAPVPAVVAAMTLLLGYAAQAVGPAGYALIADVLEPPDLRRGYALYYVGVNAGFAIGPAVGGYLAARSFALVFWVEAASMLVAALACAVLVPPGVDAVRRPEPAGAGTSVRVVLRDRVFMLFVALHLLFIAVYLQAQVTLPVVLSHAGFATTDYALLLVLNGVLLMVLQMPLERVLRAWRQSVLLAVGAGLLALGYLGQVGAGTLTAYAVCVCLWTLGELLTMPTVAGVATLMAPPALRGRYLAVSSAVWPLATLVGPTLGGVTLEAAGPTGLWLGCAAVGAVGLLGRVAMVPSLDRRVAVVPPSPAPTSTTLED
ncbi:MFS transporter [Nocardioides ginsengisoli]|uniref:MDR family MFS transporter n=1 Tax=Nocardioides ginsengisoli TaxID=363868 RepID=A0ABW3W8H6_9ACTN